MNTHMERVATTLIDLLTVSREDITPLTTLADLGADSLDGVEIVLALEEEFDIELPVEDLDPETRVGELLEMIEKAEGGSDV